MKEVESHPAHEMGEEAANLFLILSMCQFTHGTEPHHRRGQNGYDGDKGRYSPLGLCFRENLILMDRVGLICS